MARWFGFWGRVTAITCGLRHGDDAKEKQKAKLLDVSLKHLECLLCSAVKYDCRLSHGVYFVPFDTILSARCQIKARVHGVVVCGDFPVCGLIGVRPTRGDLQKSVCRKDTGHTSQPALWSSTRGDGLYSRWIVRASKRCGAADGHHHLLYGQDRGHVCRLYGMRESQKVPGQWRRASVSRIQ